MKRNLSYSGLPKVAFTLGRITPRKMAVYTLKK